MSHTLVRPMHVAALFILLLASPLSRAATTVNLSDTVVAPKSSMGVNVDSHSANIINGGCFEAAPDSNGFASQGWGWWKAAGTFTGSVDTTTFVSGKQSQKIVVSAAPAAMEQTQVDLPQKALTRTLTPSGNYKIKVMLKANSTGRRVQLGIVDANWAVHYSPAITITTSWAEYSWTYVPTSSSIWRGVAIQFLDNATYWMDNFASWDANDTDPQTGFVKTYVDRLRELNPAMLRLGGLGVNGLTLEHYLFKTWPLSYAPPPNEYLNINTFMSLCKAVNARPFITVPPAFTDTASAATQTDLTVDLVNNHYADHGNLVDYLGGDGTTTYGARRLADGYARWDTQFPAIYYELGNETWGTPDGKWDMHLGLAGDPWMQTYATYCTKRMTDMKSRPGWRPNMRVGFGGFAADSDSWAGYSTTLIPAIKNLTDFGTIYMYYGSGNNTNTDEQIYGGLFAKAQWHRRTIAAMNARYAAAAGRPIECCIYEGNCVWGNYFNGPSANDMFVYSREVSAGAAVSLLDNYAAGNAAGVTFNNHFAFTGGSWSTLTDEPIYHRKPAYHALKIFNNYISGSLITATTSGSPTWNDTLTGEQNVPYVACYPYKNGTNYSILVVNRHRTSAQTVTINRALTVTQHVTLRASDINANNETGENVRLEVQPVSSSGSTYTVTVPAFSALVIIAQDPSAIPPAVSITAPANNAKFTTGANITITANATDSDGSVAKVEFFAGSTLLGTATASPWSVTWNNVPAGSYALTAKATDNSGLSTTSTVVNISVNTAPTVSLTAPTNEATFTAGANITLTANAADSNGTISKVEFFAGATLLGTSTTAPYSFTWNNVAAGSYSLTAKATDNGGLSTTSAAVNITVSNVPPTVALTAPTNGATFTAGANITLTANAADSNGTISKVEFFAGATLLGTSTTAPYSFTWNNVAAGSYSLTAKATDNSGLSTTSAAVNITVSNVPPTVWLTSPTNGATFTAGANITLTANAADSNGTISKVEFFAGATLLGTSTTAPYSFTWNNVAAGSYSLTAKATDNGGLSTTSTAVNITVSNVPPTVSLTAPTNGATFTAGANITLTANAADSNGTISKVEFFAGGTLLGTSTTAPYSFTWNNVAAGSYSLTAKATDNSGLSTTSAAVNITVNATINAPPTVTLTSPANGTKFSAGTNITLTASASDRDGSIAKVEFFAGSTLLGTATASPWSITWNSVSAGSYALTAKATDNGGLSATSSVVNISVKRKPSVALTSPSDGTTLRAGSDITISADAVASDGSITSVEFFDGTTLLGTATQSPYSIPWNSIAAGSYAISAIATDDLGVSTASPAIRINVVADTPPEVTSPAKPGQNSVVPGQEATFSVGASGDNLQYVWDFGDGSSGTGATATHVYTSPGIYTATVTITNASGSSVSSSTQVVVLGALTVSKLSGAVHFKMTGRDTCSLKGTLAEIPQDFKPEGQIVSIEIGNVPATFTLTKNGLGRSGSNSFALKIPHGRKSAAQRTANFSTTLRGDFVPVWSAIGLDSASTSSTFTMTVNLNINQKGYTVAIPVSYTGKPGMSGRFTKR